MTLSDHDVTLSDHDVTLSDPKWLTLSDPWLTPDWPADWPTDQLTSGQGIEGTDQRTKLIWPTYLLLTADLLGLHCLFFFDSRPSWMNLILAYHLKTCCNEDIIFLKYKSHFPQILLNNRQISNKKDCCFW